jgi:hypothetical protein
MWVWVDRVGSLLLDASVSATILWAVVALVMMGSRQPARRLRLARAAMIASLALIPLIGLGMVPRINLVAVCRGFGVLPHPLLPPHWMMPTSGTPSGPLPGIGPWPARVLTLLYVSGVACKLGWLALGFALLKWLTRQSREPSAEALALYEGLPFTSLGRRPRLRVAGRISRPALVGPLRPMILIPAELDLPEARERLRLSLLHELAHAEGSDPGFGLLGNLTQGFWFFVPPVWWVSSQIRLDQEFLADRRAMLGFGPPREYASSLLEFASTRAGAPPLLNLNMNRETSGIDGQESPLFQRVLMLLHCPFPVEHRPPIWWSCGLPCLAVAVTLGIASLSVRPPPPPLHPLAAPRLNTFTMARLVVPARPAGSHGRCPLFELPIRLPERFDLTVKVWGDLATLSHTRVVGLALVSPRRSPDAVLDAETWHEVRVRRDRDGIVLRIDGEPVAPEPADRGLTAWLSVEPPPDRGASYQGMILTW